MANAVDLAIRVSSDASKATADLDKVTSKTSKLGKVGSIAGKALAAGLAAGAVGAFKLAQGAAEDQAAAAKLAQALKTTAGATDAQVKATEDWITAQGKALGVSDDELRPSLTALATATKDVGEAQRLSKIAMDVSARSGKSLQSVSETLAKAYTTGNVAALAKYKVATKNADGSTKSLEQVTKSLANTYKGSAASAADTVAGKWGRAKLQLSELGEAIGYKLIPVMAKAAEFGLQAVGWIERNQKVVAVLVGALGSLLAITWAVSKAMQAWSAISKVLTAIQWLLNAALNANPVSLIVLAVLALAVALVVAYKRSETFRKIVDTAFGAVRKAAAFAFNWIRSHWKLLFVLLTGPIGLAVLLIIKHRDRIMAAIGAVVGWVRSHWKVLFVLLTGPIGLAVLQIIKHRDKITAAIGKAVGWIKDHWSTISGVLTAPFDTARAAIQKVIDLIQKLIDKIKSIPTPHLPNIPGLRVALDPTSTARTVAASGAGGDTFYVDMSGLLDSDQAIDRLVKFASRSNRRAQGRVVIL